MNTYNKSVGQENVISVERIKISSTEEKIYII